jgi:hypothetical protein
MEPVSQNAAGTDNTDAKAAVPQPPQKRSFLRLPQMTRSRLCVRYGRHLLPSKIDSYSQKLRVGESSRKYLASQIKQPSGTDR